MRQLILHIGYPKTATTTLQASILHPLHRAGRINYLGNSTLLNDEQISETDYLIRDCVLKNKRRKDLHRFLRAAGPYLSGLLVSDIPNVLSLEHLVIPQYPTCSIEEVPTRLKEAFGAPDVVFDVVMTIREQVELIQSFYTHFYEYYYIFTADDEIETWLDNAIEGKNADLRTFDFADCAQRWCGVFGRDRMHINLYEDLRLDPKDFLQVWSSLLQLDIAELLALLGQATPRRVKDRKGRNYLVDIRFSNYIGRLLGWNAASTNSLRRFISRNLDGFAPKAIEIPFLSQTSREKIKRVYADSNSALMREFSLDARKMGAFGYV